FYSTFLLSHAIYIKDKSISKIKYQSYIWLELDYLGLRAGIYFFLKVIKVIKTIPSINEQQKIASILSTADSVPDFSR
ncbi:hypothetical protein, partial [Nostoc sp. S13]